jgi:hypothetical protein
VDLTSENEQQYGWGTTTATMNSIGGLSYLQERLFLMSEGNEPLLTTKEADRRGIKT